MAREVECTKCGGRYWSAIFDDADTENKHKCEKCGGKLKIVKTIKERVV